MSNDNKDTAPNFDSIRQINPYGVEYWSARELMPLLGYQTWREFDGVIKRAILALEQNGQTVANHFVPNYKMVEVGSEAKRRVKDYALSRQACYLVAENGNPRIPQIALAQNYFAIATRTSELQELARQQGQRVELRERVIDGNKSLNEAAAKVGVRSSSFGVFHDAGYKGLYGGLSAEEVKARKGIAPKEDLLDRAGLAELGANALRIGLTDNKLRSGQVKGEAAAVHTHHQAGKEIRQAIERFGGPMPEDLPAEPSIKPLIDERQKARKKVIAHQAQPQLTMFDEVEAEQPGSSPLLKAPGTAHNNEPKEGPL